MLFRAGLAVSAVQMKRGMGIAADESKRQQHDEAAQEQESLHGTGRQLRRVPKRLGFLHSTRPLEGEGSPHRVCRRRRWSQPSTMAKARPGTITHCSNGVRPVPIKGRTGIAAV